MAACVRFGRYNADKPIRVNNIIVMVLGGSFENATAAHPSTHGMRPTVGLIQRTRSASAPTRKVPFVVKPKSLATLLLPIAHTCSSGRSSHASRFPMPRSKVNVLPAKPPWPSKPADEGERQPQ